MPRSNRVSIRVDRIAAWLVVAVCLASASLAPACGNRPDQDPSTPDTSARAASGQPVSERSNPAGQPGTGAPSSRPRRPDETECQALLDHVLGLARADHASKVDPELVPTEKQVAAIRARLEPQFLADCQKLDRDTYGCEIKAQSQEELLACSDRLRP